MPQQRLKEIYLFKNEFFTSAVSAILEIKSKSQSLKAQRADRVEPVPCQNHTDATKLAKM